MGRGAEDSHLDFDTIPELCEFFSHKKLQHEFVEGFFAFCLLCHIWCILRSTACIDCFVFISYLVLYIFCYQGLCRWFFELETVLLLHYTNNSNTNTVIVILVIGYTVYLNKLNG